MVLGVVAEEVVAFEEGVHLGAAEVLPEVVAVVALEAEEDHKTTFVVIVSLWCLSCDRVVIPRCIGQAR